MRLRRAGSTVPFQTAEEEENQDKKQLDEEEDAQILKNIEAEDYSAKQSASQMIREEEKLSASQRHQRSATKFLKLAATKLPDSAATIRTVMQRWSTHDQIISSPLMALDQLLKAPLPKDWKDSFLTVGLPAMIRHAIACATLFPTDASWPRISKEGRQSCTLTRTHVGALISALFLCTLAKGNPSFAWLHCSSQTFQVAKVESYLSYSLLLDALSPKDPEDPFLPIMPPPPKEKELVVDDHLGVGDGGEIVEESEDEQEENEEDEKGEGAVTFTKCLFGVGEGYLPFNWQFVDKSLHSVEISLESPGDIHGAIIVFPTHKELGGGFLFRGHQEEERMYMRYPELSAILLLAHEVKDNEVILVQGLRRVNEVHGLGNTLAWVGATQDPPPKEGQKRQPTMLLGAKPHKFSKPPPRAQGTMGKAPVLNEQLNYESMAADMDKLRCGFMDENADDYHDVAAGTWGCEVVDRGNPEVKALVLWMACSVAYKKLIYCAEKEVTATKFQKIVEMMLEKGIEVGQLCRCLMQLGKQQIQEGKLFDKLLAMLESDEL